MYGKPFWRIFLIFSLIALTMKHLVRPFLLVFFVAISLQTEAQSLRFDKFFAEFSGIANPLYEDVPIRGNHMTASLGYQFQPHLGLGVSAGWYDYRVGIDYPVISFSSYFWSVDYRLVRGPLFLKLSIGHMPQVDDYSEGPVSMNYYAERFSPAFQAKLGVHFLRFFSFGLMGIHSSKLQIDVRNVSWDDPFEIRQEGFYFRTLQFFLGVGLPGYRKG